MDERVIELIDELREVLRDNVPTKNKQVPKNKDISLSSLDNTFDIDIFYTRKPGMRSSLQLVASNAGDKEYVKISCMTALASLCDTMVNNKSLNVSKEDIVRMFLGWAEANGLVMNKPDISGFKSRLSRFKY